MIPSQPNILVYAPEGAEIYADWIRKSGYSSVHSASTADEARALLDGTEILLCWKFPMDEVELPSSLKWIQSMGAGVNDWVSGERFSTDITLTRIVDQFGGPIAEYVFAYLLYLTKDIPRLTAAQKRRSWDPFLTDFLSKKTIGVAGLGSIGKEVVRKARAFDMQVKGLSVTGSSADLVDHHFTPAEWNSFVQDLDYLILTLPLTSQTEGVLNRDLLLTMKSTACVVNVGRGQLIVEQDLVDVMRKGHLRAAVLDVFENEPLLDSHPFWDMPNVYITPHLSGPSIPQEVCQFFIENLQRYSNGLPLMGVVDRTLGY
ncbi:D-2-hydroxyacid dehydrogenase [Ammoniphilus sp. YIM 78166]|uniref:D-2-hydroxyacid dehydrogenase n=1 Tax=Ammoniphilus sp. YIM 78166 TaxID=1644106 RepID=UPI00106F5D89|nr:D-2-hydroxyacid dehydrogenase [Ammoniphilus sp. YIM 78166]